MICEDHTWEPGRYGRLMSERSMPHDAASWACPHGQDARRGCVACYERSVTPDPALPFWEVAAWFTTEQPIPIRTLQDVHHHGRRFALDQPSTPLVYLLTGHARAHDSVEALAGVIGFLLHNRHVGRRLHRDGDPGHASVARQDQRRPPDGRVARRPASHLRGGADRPPPHCRKSAPQWERRWTKISPGSGPAGHRVPRAGYGCR